LLVAALGKIGSLIIAFDSMGGSYFIIIADNLCVILLPYHSQQAGFGGAERHRNPHLPFE
jgi:hypothetical protein